MVCSMPISADGDRLIAISTGFGFELYRYQSFNSFAAMSRDKCHEAWSQLQLCSISDLSFLIGKDNSNNNNNDNSNNNFNSCSSSNNYQLRILTSGGLILIANICIFTNGILSIKPIFNWNGYYNCSKLLITNRSSFIHYNSIVAIFDDDIVIGINTNANSEEYIFDNPNVLAYENKMFQVINPSDYEIIKAMQSKKSSFVATFQSK